jgi:hypothetical protein
MLIPFSPALVPETVAAVWTLIVKLSSVPVPRQSPHWRSWLAPAIAERWDRDIAGYIKTADER